MFEFLSGNNRSEIYSRRFASVYRTLSTVYDPSAAIQDEPNIEEKVLQNARLAHALNTRWEQIAGRKWTVSGGEEATPEEQVLAKITMQGLANIRRFTTARKMLARADFSGARFAEVRKQTIWAPWGDGKNRRWVVPCVIKDIPKERFRWQRTPGTKTSVHLEIFSLDADTWIPVPENAPVLRHVFDDSEETLGYGRGLREALYFVWYAVSHIHRERMDAIERFGQGRLVLKIAGDKDAQVGATNTQIRDRALATLAKMKARHEFVIGQGDELDQMEGSMTGHEMMSSAEEECYQAAEQLCMGSVLPTGGGTDKGSLARARVEEGSSDDLFHTCGDMLEESISEGLCVPFTVDNFSNLREMGLDGVPHPKFQILRDGKGDPLQNAQRIQAAQAAGLKIKRSEAYDLCELTEPGEDDDVLEPPQQASPFGAPPGGAPGDGGAGEPTQPPDAGGGDEGTPTQDPADATQPPPDTLAEWDESKHKRAEDGRFGLQRGQHRAHAGDISPAHASVHEDMKAKGDAPLWVGTSGSADAGYAGSGVRLGTTYHHPVWPGKAIQFVPTGFKEMTFDGLTNVDVERATKAVKDLLRTHGGDATVEHVDWFAKRNTYVPRGRTAERIYLGSLLSGAVQELARTTFKDDPTNHGMLGSRSVRAQHAVLSHIDHVLRGHEGNLPLTPDTLSEFDESKHHRGQPGNAGQFGPGGGSSTKGKAPTAGEAAPAKPKKAAPGSQLRPEHLERLKALGVTKLPPAEATGIEVNLDGDDVHTRAVAKWKDAKGRVQSAYTPEFHARNAADKWERVQKWAPKRGSIVNALSTSVRKGKPGTAEHAGATAALIIARTGLRPGGSDGGEEDHFGVTTLRGPHVTVDGDHVKFDYIGKSGKRNLAETHDADVARAVEAYKAKAGDGPLFPAGTLAAARASIPEGMKLKDFRTIKATETAKAWFDSFDGPPPPVTGDAKKDGKAAAKALASASDVVAHLLNNTRAVAKSSYIHPQVFEDWARRVGLDTRTAVKRAG